MNLEDVSRYIQQPSLLTLADAESLKNMSEKHPYAAVFSLLYLTALANGKSIDLDHALQEHAYRLSDRTKLYHLVHQESNSVETAIEEPQPLLADTTPVAEEKPIPDPVVETNPVEETSTEEIAAQEEKTALPDTFLAETVAFTLEQEYIPEPLPTTVTQEITTPAEAPVPASVEEEKTAEETVTTKPVSQPVTQERRSFTSWLKSNHAEETTDQPKASEQASKLAPSDIIDRFIAEEPSISRPKNEFFSPPKKAKESLDENAIPVSETLAKIYAAQGNYPKAIHVYHQLMLSFPEKKLLFAVRIEELKKKITT